MFASSDCPSLQQVQALSDLELPKEQRDAFEQHLESCSSCQDRLDRVEELVGVLRRLGREIGDPTLAPTDPTLAEFVAQLRQGKPSDRLAQDDPLDLYFLEPSPRPGTLGLLGEYEIQRVIGQGGMGVVLEAFEPALHRIVAIKVMAPALAGSATARRRFTREAQAAASVCHEHVVAVHGVDEVDGLPYLVMQYVAGESLQDRLDRAGPLEVIEIVRIGFQTASGLAAAHAQGLIHRDIKPANLLLESGMGRVKITDFGLARMADDAALTQNGVVAGTPEYMAPEQARGELVDHRADLFSLGSVLYAMGTGQPPFRGSTALGVLRLVCEQEPRPIRASSPEMPAWLEALIARLMAKDPASRLQSAAAVAELLEGYLAHLRQPLALPAPELPASRVEGASRSGRGSTRFPRSWGVAIGLVILGTIAWLAGAGPSDSGPREMKVKMHWDLRGAEPDPMLRPMRQGVKWEASGARIVLPPGDIGGIAPNLVFQGDFEITASYEILEADRPSTGYGVGVSLYAAIDPDTNDAVSLARRTMPNGKVMFVSNRMTPVPGKPTRNRVKTKPSSANTGKLRIQRIGPRVRFLVQEGVAGAFSLVDESEFGTKTIRFVQFGGNLGGAKSKLDLRLLELTIHSEGAPSNTSPEAEGALSSLAPRTAIRGTLTALVLLSLSGLTLLGLGLWFFTRQRRQPAKAALPASGKARQDRPEATTTRMSVTCPGCATRLEAKGELAGKQVKCPRCGQPVLVAAGDAPGPGVVPATPRTGRTGSA